jgi:hypothetical protein
MFFLEKLKKFRTTQEEEPAGVLARPSRRDVRLKRLASLGRERPPRHLLSKSAEAALYFVFILF